MVIHPRKKQKGVLLVIVVGAMAILGGVITVITGYAASYHQQRKNDLLCSCLQFATDSAVYYVKENTPQWAANQPSDTIELNIDHLLLPQMEGTASLTFNENDEGIATCHIRVHLKRHNMGKRKDVYIPIHQVTRN